MAAYKIGNFTFDTEEEYARGLEDAKKIEKIQNTVDLNEPETALRLYWLIRTGKIKFGSKVGKKFFLDIADVVAKSAAKNITQSLHAIVRQPVTKELMKEIRDLNNLGTNVNTLVKLAHQNGLTSVANQAKEALEGINSVLRQARLKIKEKEDEDPSLLIG